MQINLGNFLDQIIIDTANSKNIFTNSEEIYYVNTDLENKWFNFIAGSHKKDFHATLLKTLQSDFILATKFKYCQSIIFSALSHAKYKGTEKLDFSANGYGYKQMQMNYNANCTERAILQAFNGKLIYDDKYKHLYSFSGFGKNSADLQVINNKKIKIDIIENEAIKTVEIGPKLEVKDYFNHINLSKSKVEFHDSNEAFIHFIGDFDNYNKLYLITKYDKVPKLIKDINLNYDHNQVKINGLYGKQGINIVDIDYWREF